MRADAQRNREQIIEAARELFLAQGLGAPMEEVARRAGVGVGTLYRRFPDRDALLHAVGVDTLTQLATLASTARTEEPDAWSALRRFLRGAIDLRLGQLQAMLDGPTHEALRAVPGMAEQRQSILADLTWLIERAQADGTLRRDVGLAEIGTIMTLRTTPPSSQVIEIVLDGLVATAGLR